MYEIVLHVLSIYSETKIERIKQMWKKLWNIPRICHKLVVMVDHGKGMSFYVMGWDAPCRPVPCCTELCYAESSRAGLSRVESSQVGPSTASINCATEKRKWNEHKKNCIIKSRALYYNFCCFWRAFCYWNNGGASESDSSWAQHIVISFINIITRRNPINFLL